MSGHTVYGSAQDPIDEEERELLDPETWDWASAQVGVTDGEPGTTFSLEFSRDEHRVLADAAAAAGNTTHAYIKRASLAAARDTPSGAGKPVGTTRGAAG